MALKKYKDYIVVFLFFGIPFFVESFIFFSDINWQYSYVPEARSTVKILELVITLFSFCVSYIYLSEFRKYFFVAWIFLFYMPMLLNLSAFRITGTLITDSFMQAIFNTDFSEAIACLKAHIMFIIVNVIILVSALFYKVKVRKNKRYGLYGVALFIFAFSMSEFFPIFKIVLESSRYFKDISAYKFYNEKHVPLTNIKISNNSKQVYVLVIGESVDRNHMGIYGYKRQTTPYFSAMKSNLFAFNNVEAVYSFTSEAVKAIFTLNINGYNHYTLINFFKDAGFKTFWFSNQGKSHVFENEVAHLGKSSDYFYSINNGNIGKQDKYDISLVDLLKNALKDKAQKKFIVLHMMGSHFPLWYRYPNKFAKFSSDKRMAKADSVTYTNSLYDDSILYTDYVLNEVIKELRKEGCISWMLYLSDHGQEIKSEEDCVWGSRKGRGTYEIPFVIWVSDEYRRKNGEFIARWNLSKAYLSDKTAYSLIDLARMKHDSVDSSKSIFYGDITDQ
ncbi:MAG: sulfatase-like hydrolase/transferase [Alphaproteobacteria bacterium]|nr:sulfatase-like hydrolase/transferase [Alphaproteobacteria bacterium]